MATSTLPAAAAVRADLLPEGLCVILADADCPGGLAWKEDGAIGPLGWPSQPWVLFGTETRDHSGVPMTPVPACMVEASTDPVVRACASATWAGERA